MVVAIAIVSFMVGFMLSSMFCWASKVELEEELEEKNNRIKLALGYIQVLLTGDLELNKEDTLESLKSVLKGSDKEWNMIYLS